MTAPTRLIHDNQRKPKQELNEKIVQKLKDVGETLHDIKMQLAFEGWQEWMSELEPELANGLRYLEKNRGSILSPFPFLPPTQDTEK
jgi:hypothetical protein